MQWNALLLESSRRLKELRCALEDSGYFDNSRQIIKVPKSSSNACSPSADKVSTEQFVIPITQSCVDKFKDSSDSLPDLFVDCKLISFDLPHSKRERIKCHKPCRVLREAVKHFLTNSKEYCLNPREIDDLLLDVPTSWERHGDLVVLSEKSFGSPKWKLIIEQEKIPLPLSDKSSISESFLNGDSVGSLSSYKPCKEKRLDNKDSPADVNLKSSALWQLVASAMNCKRLAIDQTIACNHYRSSNAQLLLGESGCVKHIDNGVCYIFDVTKCMFSSGNISEKLRVARFNCKGETIVDLYAGIGYFTLPYLVHTGASVVHACEWNPDAIEALQKGLVANKVEDRCVIHRGDNRMVALKGVADRVNLGLVPSSEEGWPVACKALNNVTGGWLHIHGNVCSKNIQKHTQFHSTEFNPWDIEDTKLQCAQPTEKVDVISIHSSSSTPSNYSSQLSSPNDFPKISDEAIRKRKVQHVYRQDVWHEWGDYVAEKILKLLRTTNSQDSANGKRWCVTVRHIEHVKSYAPHIDHMVVDLECRPVDLL